MVIVWFLLGIATVLALGWLLSSSDDRTAEAILERRYARGEIDRETFERMLDDLSGNAKRLRDDPPGAQAPHASGSARR